jgi:tRNA (guanine-N7-)-methyltransferase
MSRKRIRAHANPLSDVDVDWPITPEHVPWHEYYPAYIGAGNKPLPAALAAPAAAADADAGAAAAAAAVAASPDAPRSGLSEVRIADVGCGFGGMSVALAEIFPDKLVLGLEIRDPVVALVQQRCTKLRKEAVDNKAKPANAAAAASAAAAAESGFHPTHSASPSPAPWMPHAPSYARSSPSFNYNNVWCVKTNFMKYAPNYFRQGQLERIFFLFADPHFKRANFRRRVISPSFLDIYAYILQPNGLLYTITDVADLHNWHVGHLDAHPLFARIPDAELASDPCFLAMHSATEEGQKVTRLSGQKFAAVYRRIEAPKEKEEPTE